MSSPYQLRYRHGRTLALLCSVALVACVLIARPFAEIGVEDDWSYIRSAQVLAQTGHIVYNGWATAMLGWQLYLGAAAIKLFGFSFTVARASVLTVAAATIFLLHRVLVRLGLTECNAAIASLALMASPLVIPLAFTFHTDVPGLFCVLIAIYGCLRAIDAPDDRRAIAWLVVASVAGDLGGTARQIAWLASLVIVPCAVFLLWRRRPVLIAGILLWVSTLAFVFACMHWFKSQPYSVPEKIFEGGVHRKTLKHAARSVAAAVEGTPLFLLPILLAFVPRFPWRNWRAVALATVGVLTYVIALTIEFGKHHQQALDAWLEPFTVNIVSVRGLVDSSAMLGERPMILHHPARLVLTLVCVVATMAFCARALFVDCPRLLRDARCRRTGVRALVLLGPFTLAYGALLLPRAASSFILDRYLIPVLVVLTFTIVYLFQGPEGRKLPALSIAGTVLFMLAGIAGMHDLFAMERGRLAAIDEIRRAGVPRTHLAGGFEYDSWTQVEQVGYVADARIKVPAGIVTYQAAPFPCANDTWYLTPSVHPEYLLSFDLKPCKSGSSFPPVVYRTWLPPYSTTIYILKADPGEKLSPKQ